MTNTGDFTVKVARKWRSALDIVGIELVPMTSEPLPSFTAGAHIDIDFGRGIRRQYSLANDPAETHRYLLGVLKDPNSRGCSKALHDYLQEGDVLRIGQPRNHFPLEEGAEHSILIGGGIGVTPMLSMASRLHTLGKSFELHYCSRAEERAAFLTELAEAPYAAQVKVHFDNGSDDQMFNLPSILSAAPDASHLYVCGPIGFMNYVIDTSRLSLPEAQIHKEFFDAPTTQATNHAFEVEIKSSGLVIEVPADRGLIDVLHDHGIMIPRMCPKGVCGGCRVKVLEGTVEHRDAVLPDAAKEMGLMLACVSRAGENERLVLDL